MKIEIQWVVPHRLVRSHQPGRYSPNNKLVGVVFLCWEKMTAAK